VATANEIPPVIQRAYELLVDADLVEIKTELKAVPDGGGRCDLQCIAPVPENKEGLPTRALLKIEIPRTFPFHPVEVYSCEETIRSFPHQDAETHKLCLPPDSEAPYDETKLRKYVEWSIAWLGDAATERLVEPGDPYELPDFSRKQLSRPLPVQEAFFFVETTKSFDLWKGRVGQTGGVFLARPASMRCYLALRFLTEKDDLIWQPPFSDYARIGATERTGHWILLPDIRYYRQRPAQTYGELGELCKRAGIDLDRHLNRVWREDNQSSKWGVLLIGFPIPARFGEDPTEIHWQPLFIDGLFSESDNFKFRIDKKHFARWKTLTSSGKFGPSEQLPWGASTNVSAERYYSRGAFSPALRELKVMVCGCGAIGSVTAELLARDGVANLCLLDGDQFELGNQSRHTLDGASLRQSKALALAARLSSCNLLSTITGHHATLPIYDLASPKNAPASESLAATQLLVDCTANEGAFLWLNRFARESQKRLASLFISFNARFLTFCVSGKHTSCAKVARRLFRDVQNGQTPIPPGEYFRVPEKDEQVIPGAGCWHPTFPARIDHVWMMTSAAIDLLDRLIMAPIVPDGTAAVFKRNDVVPGSPTRNIVELVWLHQYR
jgi:hypothetical protein